MVASNEALSFSEYEEEVAMGGMAPVRTLEEEFRAEIEKLRKERDLAIENMGIARMKHYGDIKRIGEEMMALAEREGERYCDDYDNAVDELNKLLHAKLPVRPKSYKVRVALDVFVVANDATEAAAAAQKHVSTAMTKYCGPDNGVGFSHIDPGQVERDEDD
jgi:hypothetical protein